MTRDAKVRSFTMASTHGGPRSVVAGNEDGCDGEHSFTMASTHGGPRSVVAGNGDGRDGARPSRRTPTHQPIHEIFNRSTIVFVTICSQDKRPLFNKPDIHGLLKEAWIEADAWRVGRYVVMPDHIHLFCAPGRHDYPSLKNWVQFWKSVASRSWPRQDEQPVWQKSFWDTQLRREDNYLAKWQYVRNNPVRAGLCGTPEEWPFQGEMNTLIWHD